MKTLEGRQKELDLLKDAIPCLEEKKNIFRLVKYKIVFLKLNNEKVAGRLFPAQERDGWVS